MDEDEERKMIIGGRSLGLHMPFRLQTEKMLAQKVMLSSRYLSLCVG